MSRLAELTAALKTQITQHNKSAEAPAVPNPKSVLFLGTPDDKEFIHLLKGMFNGYDVAVICTELSYLTQLENFCKAKSVTRVVSTSPALLGRLVSHFRSSSDSSKDPKIDNYAGSIFDYKGIEILFIDPLAQLQTVPYGKFVTTRYISKIVAQNQWREPTPFKWEVLTPANIDLWYHEFQSAYATAIDIETLKENLIIRCISFTGVFISATNQITTQSLVLPVDSMWAVEWMRKFCDTRSQKIFQRGKYDNNYLLRYSCPTRNWLWDTANCMHSWYSELPKDLAFLNAFFLRKVVYWKDLAETSDVLEYYRYNAMDGWATANVWIEWIIQSPAWAKRNYTLEFPIVFPCILAEMTGIERDMDRMIVARKEFDEKEKQLLHRLRTILGDPNFNPGSPQQVVKVLHILGDRDADSSGAVVLARAKLAHPLNAHIISLIEDIRELRKRRSNYLRLDSDAKSNGEGGAKEFQGRILYALNPDGTDTTRLASREHHFWCGLQIQNIERGPAVKQTLKASNGFYIGESDLEQAESRDTGYISGDPALISAVESPRDFHSINCSAFFGIPYDDIFDDESKSPKDKKLRDLSKRVNHGFNYNMGDWMLIQTMGLDKVWEAGRLLKLPTTEPRAIAQYLLACADKTYSGIKGKYYVSVKAEILATQRLTSRAFHHTEYNLQHYKPNEYIEQGDWVRFCFGRPDIGKTALNSYVAHCPQSLNARTLNEAYMRVFYDIALSNPLTFRLHAQIHDSILFSYAAGREDHAYKVRELMEIPVTIRDVSGIVRTFVVPAALKLGKKDKKTGEFKRAVYWSETE